MHLRQESLHFAQVISDHDLYRNPKRDRRELRKALQLYLEQEFSVYLERYLDSDEGSMTLSAVERIYNAKPPQRSARWGTSGYHK